MEFLDLSKEYATDRKFDTNRLRAMELILLVLQQLPKNILSTQEFELIFKIASWSLETDVICAKFASAIITVIITQFA